MKNALYSLGFGIAGAVIVALAAKQFPAVAKVLG